jgi:hypothetical protein
MKISKPHKLFSNYLEQPEVLKNPGKYLGPNYQDVLNFWVYVDALSDEEKEEMDDLYWDLDFKVRESARIASIDAARGVVGWRFREAAWWAAYDITGSEVFGFATYELIAHHKILEQNKTPTYLPLCVKS